MFHQATLDAPRRNLYKGFSLIDELSHQGDSGSPVPATTSLSVSSFVSSLTSNLAVPNTRLVSVSSHDIVSISSPSLAESAVNAANKNISSSLLDLSSLSPSHASVSPHLDLPIANFGKRKYKPVALKTRPVITSLPERFRIIRDIRGDPLASIPALSPVPPPFVPTGRYTDERHDIIDSVHPAGFLWPSERALMHHFMCLQNEGFAWDDSERGRFRDDFFPPVEVPIVDHKPWVLRNIPIPPGIYHEVCALIRRKIAAGVYEPSNSSYRS